MGDVEVDELAALMPRTQAATARARVDMDNLKQYMAAAQQDPAPRSSVMIRADVRKDAEGFEDIDDFWADEDVAGDKDDTEGEESSILSEGVASSANVSMASEMAVNLSGFDAASSGDESDHGALNDTMEVDGGSPNDTMELESQTSQRDSAKSRRAAMTPPKSSEDTTMLTSSARSSHAKKPLLTQTQTPPATTPERQRKPRAASTSPAFNNDVDFSFGDGGSPPMSAQKTTPRGSATPAKSRRPSPTPTLSSGAKAAQKKKLRRESFGGADGFANVGSPFSILDAVLTPLSNASEKNLMSIKPFSENGSSANSPTASPNIRVTLFKSSEKGADDWDGDNITRRVKKPKPAAAAKDVVTPKKKTRKIAYKSTPTSEMSFEDEHTDNDDGSFLANSGFASDDNDSDYGGDGKSLNRTATSVCDGDLSYADEILKDSGKDSDGLRRSKRKRYKPLAWYKGEHYVYERRQSGVGLVIPTVAAIERAGTMTPMKKSRPTNASKPRAARTSKPLPRDKLPDDLIIAEDGWADLWDNAAKCMNKMNVVCRADEIENRDLPSVGDLPSGYAGQSFNLRNPTPFSRWICGRLGLPAGAAKEAESVGDAVQVFIVMGGQPQALEIALGPAQDGVFDPKNATRFLLNPNDEFYIPAQNAYYLKNHSETSATELRFMILKDNKARGGDATKAEPTASAESTPAKPRRRSKT